MLSVMVLVGLRPDLVGCLLVLVGTEAEEHPPLGISNQDNAARSQAWALAKVVGNDAVYLYSFQRLDKSVPCAPVTENRGHTRSSVPAFSKAGMN